MRIYKEYIIKALLAFLFFSILFFVGILLYQINGTKEYLVNELPICLETSVKKYIEFKMEGAYYSAVYEYDPNKRKIGEYEDRIFKNEDTTFIYRSRIVSPAEDAFRGFQSTFLDRGELYADSIQALFDSLLQVKNIHVQSIVGITASFYTKKNEWSADTTSLDINYRTAFTNQGGFEDINYYAYIHYSPSTIWALMYKAPIYILFIFILIIWIILHFLAHKRKKEIANGIECRKDGNYRIRGLIYYTNERRFILEEKEVKLSPQLHELLLMFLKADKYKVAKAEIKQKFWPKSIDATGNMTSTVNRLNKELKEAKCPYTIVTDSKNEEFYVFCLLPPSSPESL